MQAMLWLIKYRVHGDYAGHFGGPGELIPLFIRVYEVVPAALSGLKRTRGNYVKRGETTPGKHRLVQENNP